MSSRGLGTLTSDVNIDELRKILRDDFNFLPNWVKLVDPVYDYDFCGINDSGKTFYRGGRRYYRPVGWKRFALKVAGQYENDDWLAGDNSGWVVAYHGTEEVNCNPITANGFAISSHGAYGPGVYVSPLIDFAAAYARPVTLTNGLKVVVVLQNRVKPGSFSEHHVAGKPCPKHMCKPPCAEQFPYFKGSALEYVVSNPSSVRPYGICVKLLTPKQATHFKRDADSVSELHSQPKELKDKPASCQIM